MTDADKNNAARQTVAAHFAANPLEAFTMPRVVYLSGAKFAGYSTANRAENTQAHFAELVASGAVVKTGRYSAGYPTYQAAPQFAVALTATLRRVLGVEA